MADLDGEWEVQRTGGLLPPMRGLVRKQIDGARGRTVAAGIPMPFDVVGPQLRYRAPLVGLVDELVHDGPDACDGTAFLFGRRVGTFRMTRATAGRSR